MGFGMTGTTAINRTSNHTVQVAEQINPQGDIVDMHTFGGAAEVTEEVYVNASAFDNEAINGQGGESVVSAHNLIEDAKEYCRATKTTRSVMNAATTTTAVTTTT